MSHPKTLEPRQYSARCCHCQSVSIFSLKGIMTYPEFYKRALRHFPSFIKTCRECKNMSVFNLMAISQKDT